MTPPKSVSLVHVQSLLNTCVSSGQLNKLVNRSKFKTEFVSVRPSFPCVPYSNGWFYHYPHLPWPETSPRPFPLFDLLHSLWTPWHANCLFTIGFISSPSPPCSCQSTDRRLVRGLLEQPSGCLSLSVSSLILYFPARLGCPKCGSDCITPLSVKYLYDFLLLSNQPQDLS